MGKLLEGFKILCTEFDHILEKGGNYSRGDIIEGRNYGNTVFIFALYSGLKGNAIIIYVQIVLNTVAQNFLILLSIDVIVLPTSVCKT